MEDLLRSNEKRRLHIAEILYARDDWMTISELSKELDVSVRILKYDIENFKKSFDDFTIETSNRGIRLLFHGNKGLKTLYKNVLEHSTPFQLLETIFFNETYSTFELAELLYVSPSTLYRMIDHINKVILPYDFKVETNPCRMSGNESAIRSFYYQYFYEKYTRLDWPFETNDAVLDNLLYFIIDFTKVEMDFALYNLFKLTTTVNYVRFKHKRFIEVDESRMFFLEVIPVIEAHAESLKYFEETMNEKVDTELLTQLFFSVIDKGFSLNYERLMVKTKNNKKISNNVNYLNEFLDELSLDNHIPLLNKEEMIFGIHNSAYLELFDPRSGYILHNRNKHFVEGIKKEFPSFSKQLFLGIKKFRKLAGLPESENGLNYLMYITYSYWKGLTLNLRNEYKKVRVLIVSNRHISHSYMLKDFIEYEFSDRLEIDIFDDVFLTDTILEELDHDFIIANFPLPELQSKNCLCIENIPTYQDIAKIQKEIDEVILTRMNK